jgi:uncharacterized membrane protein YoaK (UPF0700 family)
VKTFLTEVRDTLIPDLGGKHGPFPPLLVLMTFVTGLVDAFSYLVLGHVFVANMTGNVVFLGFALAGAPGFSLDASLVALACFWLGALAGGRAAKKFGQHRGHMLGASTAVQTALIGISVLLAALSGNLVTSGYRYGLIVLLASAMGIQNATVRQLAVPDLTTTVLTMTLTGLGADSAIAGGKGAKSGRRLIAVAAMFLGALVGAAFVLHIHIVIPLVIAAVVLAIVAITTSVLGKSDPIWAKS